MTKERKLEIINGSLLTQEEFDAGYHFCTAWNGVLIGPDNQQLMAGCSCYDPESEIYNFKRRIEKIS